jgi:restriction endonuclease S subunit
MSKSKSLKPGWKQVKFGDVVRLSKARCADPLAEGVERYIGLEHLEPGDLRIRNWGNVADGVTFTSVFLPGQVLFGKRRAYQRKVAVADFSGVCSGDIYVMETKDATVLLPELLPFICQADAFFAHAVDTSAGSLSPRTNWTSLSDFEFALPSIDWQQKLCVLLASAAKSSESIFHALAKLRKLKDSFSKHAFSKGLRGDSVEVQAVHYKEIPCSWTVKPLSEVFEILDNRRVPLKDADRNKRKGQYPYYGASGVIDQIDGYIFDEPILLLSEDGMNLLYRSSPLIYKVTERCWVNNHAHVLKPMPHADIDFYAEYLESISFDPFVTGTYQKKITKSDCSRIPLPVPPLNEQHEIVEKFAEINRQIDGLLSRLESSKGIQSAISKSILGATDVQ